MALAARGSKRHAPTPSPALSGTLPAPELLPATRRLPGRRRRRASCARLRRLPTPRRVWPESALCRVPLALAPPTPCLTAGERALRHRGPGRPVAATSAAAPIAVCNHPDPVLCSRHAAHTRSHCPLTCVVICVYMCRPRHAPPESLQLPSASLSPPLSLRVLLQIATSPALVNSRSSPCPAIRARERRRPCSLRSSGRWWAGAPPAAAAATPRATVCSVCRRDRNFYH